VEFSQFYTHSQRDPRVARILAAGLVAVDPGAVVQRYIQSNPLSPARRVFALGVGKAALLMTQAVSQAVPLTRALVITKRAPIPGAIPNQNLDIFEGSHPVPDSRSVTAGWAALEFVSRLEPDDLLVCLISGGGSALMSAPIVPLEDLQTLTSALLACGARIDEINTLRRHLDRVKGGGIARATRASVLSMILSDVVDSPLEAIASGPTAPDPTTKEDALGVLIQYDFLPAEFRHLAPGDRLRADMRAPAPSLPPAILRSLLASPETSKPDDPVFSRVHNVIVGDNALAAKASLAQAEKEGFQTEYLGSTWQGEARVVGVELALGLRRDAGKSKTPCCMISGGETTVTLRAGSGKGLHDGGKGGRNQELALGAVSELAGAPGVMLITLATDGEDGPTDAAGAVVTGETRQRAEALGLDSASHLSRNDSYPYFDALGDLLKIGATGTNVNDLTLLLKF